MQKGAGGKGGPRLVFRARRDIKAGEELSVDYTPHGNVERRDIVCSCGSDVCRGWLF